MLDAEFGQGGILLLPSGVPYGAVGAMKPHPDGGIIIATNEHLLKLTETGSWDTSFGVSGIAEGVAEPRDLHVQADGRLIVIGGSLGMTLRRTLSDGTNDSQFGTNGLVDLGSWISGTFPSSIVSMSDNSIIISYVTSSPPGILLNKRTSDGGSDLAFGTNGFLETGIFASLDFVNSIVVDDEDRIMVAGTLVDLGNTAAVLRRYLSDGTIDPSFGINGTVLFTIPGITAYGMHSQILPDGRIIMAGSTFQVPTFQPWMARFDEAGTLDVTFGTNGHVVGPSVQGSMVRPKHVHITNEGSLYLAGDVSAASGITPWAQRLSADGSMDLSFGTAGVFTYDFTDCTLDFARTSTVLPDGALLIAGSLSCPSTPGYVMKLRTSISTSDQASANSPALFRCYMDGPDALVIQANETPSPLVIELYTATGGLCHRVVLPHPTIGGARLPLPRGLAPGIHLVRITHPQGSYVQRIHLGGKAWGDQ